MASSRLRSLGLDIGFPTSGCVWYSPSRDYCGFAFAGEAFPPLEELDVVNYPWGWPPWLPRGLFWVDGYPTALGPGSQMENWASLRDWSRLRRLRLVGHSVTLAGPLAPKLTALKPIELITHNPVLNTRIAPAFATLPCALTSITLAVLPPDLIPLIISHAASLRALSVHHVPIPPTDLALLRDNLPNLDTLTLRCDPDPIRDHNLDPNPTESAYPCPWPCTTTTTLLTTLAGFPRLASLTLRISPHPDPPVTITTPGLLLATLRARGAARPRTLHLNVSGVPPGGREDAQLELGVHTAAAAGGDQDNCMFGFVCTWPSDPEPEDGAAWMESEEDGTLPLPLPLLDASRCVNLSWAQNERLRAVARGEPMTEREARTLEFVVALRGPLGMPGEWEAWKETGWVENGRDAVRVVSAETLKSGWVLGRRVREKARPLFAT